MKCRMQNAECRLPTARPASSAWRMRRCACRPSLFATPPPRHATVIVIVVVSAAIGAAAALAAQTAQTRRIGSLVFQWDTLEARTTAVGTVRSVVRAPTPTLGELEMHVTTLNPGAASHAPHRHQAEELLIVKEGTVETLQNGVATRCGPGSIIFHASNDLHNIRNVGSTPATYHVIQWQVPGAAK